jgi:hypothetical protein
MPTIRKIIAKDETAVKAANIVSIGFFFIDGFNVNSFFVGIKTLMGQIRGRLTH